MTLLNCTDKEITLLGPEDDARIVHPSGFTIHIEMVRVKPRSIPVSYWGKPYRPTVAMTAKSSIPVISEKPARFSLLYKDEPMACPNDTLLIVSRGTALLAALIATRLKSSESIAWRMVWPAVPTYNEGSDGRLNGTVKGFRELHSVAQ